MSLPFSVTHPVTPGRDSLTDLSIALKIHLPLLLVSKISDNDSSPLPRQSTSNTYSCNLIPHPPMDPVIESLFQKKNRYSSGYLHPTHLHPTTRRRTVSPPPETARIAGGTPSLPIQSTRNPDEYYTADRRNQSAPFILPPSTDTGRTHKRFFSFLRSNSSKSFLRNRAYSTHPPKKSFKFYRQISCITQTQFPTLCYANW